MLLPLSALAGLLLTAQEPAIKVRMVVDEPRAVLSILKKREESKPITDSDWEALFNTEGYKRLKERELGMGRSFTEDDFKKFMLSDELFQRRSALKETLERWQKVDVVKCATRSLTYLPKGAKLQASVLLLIKPRPNSFVWNIREDPAVMLYLDPEMSADDLATTIAHEFHHVGYESSCPSPEFTKWRDMQPKERQSALVWQMALGEGYAVLAAAGGISPNPVGTSKKDVRDAWKEGMARLPEDMEKLQRFFLDILDQKLNSDTSLERGRSFYGMVGPWYTVGYHVAVTIEQAYGRQKLIECFLDPRQTLLLYNAAATKINARGGKLFIWSDELLKKMGCLPQG